jgi:hypothetical protein
MSQFQATAAARQTAAYAAAAAAYAISGAQAAAAYAIIIITGNGYQSSHSNIAIGPAPHWSGRRRKHSSIVLASIAVIPGTNKIVSNQPSNLSANLCHVKSICHVDPALAPAQACGRGCMLLALTV